MHQRPEHSPPTHHQDKPAPGYGAVGGWAAGIIITIAVAVVAIWQVNEQVYAPEATAQSYWDALADGEGPGALGHFVSAPDFTEDSEIDHLLLTGAPLAHSAELIDSPEISESDDGAQLSFTAGDEEYTTELPLSHVGTTWGFFDEWKLSPAGITWFQLEVPGAPEGGIGQVEVNGEPVNLDEDTARLSAFVPTVAEISIESQWLTGAASHVATAPEVPEESAGQVTMELEASEAAADLLHEELADYFEDCDQQVLMPSGCPVGMSTTHQVDADTIDWTFPDPEEFELTFDADGWQVNYEDLAAEVSFEARHFHTGEQLTETEDVPFDLNVQVRASGEDLMVSVASSE